MPSRRRRSAEEVVRDVEKNRARKKAAIERWGDVPTSILRVSRGRLSRIVRSYQAEHPETKSDTRVASERAIGDPEYAAARERDFAAAGLRPQVARLSRRSELLSQMPADLVAFFIDFYLGDERPALYIDPFAGQAVRMQVAAIRGLDYVGFDVAIPFVRFAERVREGMSTTRDVRVILRDARDPSPLEDGSGDFTFTSPPYYSIEDYGDDPGQLGKGTYPEFLAELEEIVRAWRPKYRPGAYVVWNVNDFRLDGRLVAFHADVIRIFESSGYDLDAIWILAGLTGAFAKTFGMSFVERKLPPKVHEYALVFRVPGGSATRRRR